MPNFIVHIGRKAPVTQIADAEQSCCNGQRPSLDLQIMFSSVIKKMKVT